MTPPVRFALVLLAAMVFLAGPSLVRFYTDWLWFAELGYQPVYLRMLQSQATLFTFAFVASALWLAFNLSRAVAAIGNVRPVFTTRDGIELALPAGRQLRTLALGAAVVIAVLVGLFAAGRWEVWQSWRLGVSSI
jgi:uncharacterized membrane protein (UPF0182 family)